MALPVAIAISLPSCSFSKSPSRHRNPNYSYCPTLRGVFRPNRRLLWRIYAENGGSKNDGTDGAPPEESDEGKAGNRRPRFNLRWLDLVLDPDPDNVVAVGLTGLLAWASVQVLWQLFLISDYPLVIAVFLISLEYIVSFLLESTIPMG